MDCFVAFASLRKRFAFVAGNDAGDEEANDKNAKSGRDR
jgi:hypothetical protein